VYNSIAVCTALRTIKTQILRSSTSPRGHIVLTSRPNITFFIFAVLVV